MKGNNKETMGQSDNGTGEVLLQRRVVDRADSYRFAGTDRDAYKMIGNGVSVPVGEWFGKELVRYFS